MRQSIALIVVAVSLLLPSLASATTQTASAGGVSATLSYTGGPGITTKDLRLSISQGGAVKYNQPVTSKLCFKTCSPESAHSVHVVLLSGNGAMEVVLDLFTGGADCCTIEQIFTPSASIGTYYLTQRNFGPGGAKLEDLSHNGSDELVGSDANFYCHFSACFASGLPIQIFSFTNTVITNVTRQYPAAIAKDAEGWWKAYTQHPSQGEGLIAAWAADENELGKSSAVASTLAAQVRARHITTSFVTQLKAFLRKHGYT